jgi:hypothetical protein
MTLTRGDDSRLDGAPSQELPNYADMVDKVATMIFNQDPARYGGEVSNARSEAVAYIKQKEAEKQAAAAAQRAAGQRAVAERDAARDARRGVDPEAIPYATSSRDIQEANRPIGEAEAALEMEQVAADDIIRGSREGQRNWVAEDELRFLRERGEQNPLAGPGQRDLDVRRRLMEQRGQFYEMPDGTRIPVGADPTAASMRNLRGFEDWANETPGTERQALYNPAGYEQFREGVRNDIRDNARADEAKYGTGSDAQLLDAAENGNRMAADQYKNRQARRQSETRVRNAQRGRFYEDKLMVDAGIVPPKPEPGANIEQLERAAFRGRYARRQNELAARKQARIDQAMMAGGQPTGGPFGTRATTTAINQLGPGWREIALLDRLTQGRVGGPTPLAVEGANAAAAAQMAQQAMVAFLRNNPGATPAQEAAAREQLRGLNPAAAGAQDIAAGELERPEAQTEFSRLAESLDNTYGGMSYDNEMAMAAALQKPPYNLDQGTAEELAYRYSEKRRWSSRQRGAPAPKDPGLPPPGGRMPL